jgi:hypothetical protein
LLNGEEPLWSDKARLAELPVLEIRSLQFDGRIITSRASRNLAEDQVVTWKIDQNEGGAALSRFQIRLRERNDDDFAGYRFAHATSSSGEFQSRARTDSLNPAPLNDSAAAFFFRSTAKS